MPPEQPINPLESMLEATIHQNEDIKSNGDETNNLLQALLAQGQESPLEPVLVAQLTNDNENTSKIVDKLSEVVDVLKEEKETPTMQRMGDFLNQLKGENGEKGDKGDTGEKGEKGEDGKDGIDGINGKDGLDGKDGTDGKDGKNGRDGLDGLDGKDGKDGKDGSPDTGEEIVTKLSKLKGEKRLDVKAIKGIEKMQKQIDNSFLLGNNSQSYRINGSDIASNAKTLNLKAGSNITLSGVATTDGADITISSTGGGGTVTSVSVVPANGLYGSVATETTTPAITLGTTVTGMLKGNGIAISTAVAGTDFVLPATLTTTLLDYALLAGRATPQQLNFGTASGASTGYLSSTSHATKGKYFLNAAGTMTVDDLNVRLGVGVASPAATAHFLSTTDQLWLSHSSGNEVKFTVSSGGLLSLQTTAGATAGVYTLTPHGAGGAGTNRTLSFGAAWGNAAMWLYTNGAGTRFGWGMQADAMQFFAPTTTGGVYTWNRGGDLQATGTNELLRLQQYAAGTGAGLGLGSAGFAPTTPYRIDFQGVSATTGSAGVEGILRFSRIQTGGVSYPEAFAIALGRWSSSGFGPDTRVDFQLKSTAATNYTTDATVLTLQSDLTVIGYGNLKLSTVGGGLYVKEGTNATMGASTLVAGTVTVSTTKVTASSRIHLTIQSLGTVATPKAIGVTARTAGTSFTITSADATDTSVIAWQIIEPA